MAAACPYCAGTGHDALFDSVCGMCDGRGHDPEPLHPRGMPGVGCTLPHDDDHGHGPGRGGTVTVERATAKQLALIERLGGAGEVEDIDALTKKAASVLIDKLLGKAEAPGAAPAAPATAPERTNRYAGPCRRCGRNVEAEAGLLLRADGRWVTEHRPGACEAAIEQAKAAPAVEATEGMWLLTDGRIARLQRSRESGNLYGKVLDDHGHFGYEPGLLRMLDRRLTEEEAAAYGRRTGRCCVCARELTDPESIERGIGPICLSKL